MSITKIINFTKIEEKCNIPKIEAIQTYILNNAKTGDTYEIHTKNPDTWYAIKNLAQQLEYEIIEEHKENNTYIITIKIK